MLLWETSQRKVLILGQRLASQILLQIGSLGSMLKEYFKLYASLMVKDPLGE
jgi:hypothetical protein